MFKKLIFENRPILYLLPFYFFFRLLFLTKIPIFNDEGIYLDWAWKMIHIPGQFFYSLQDAKQPLIFWFFGLSRSVISDPLLAGRFVSVMTGLLSLFGLYVLSKEILGKKFALVTPILYVLAPLFSFFDRQALMESAVSAVIIWSCYFFLLLVKNQSNRNASIFGALLGIGFLIKSTIVIPFVVVGILTSLIFLTKKSKNSELWKDILLSVFVSQIILVPLYLQNMFWSTLSKNSQFSMTIPQLLHFPIGIWIQNISSFIQISFWQLTPPVFVAALFGIFMLIKKSLVSKILVLWFMLSSLLFVLVATVVTVRYSVPFLPLSFIFAAYAFKVLYTKQRWIAFLFAGACACCLGFVLFLQLLFPLRYFDLLAKVTTFSQKGDYVTSWTSGYGVEQVTEYIVGKAAEKGAVVGINFDVGNPQNAVTAYFENTPRVGLIVFDGRLFADLDRIDCFHSEIPFYFVSRENQLSGLDKYLVEDKRFYVPEGKTYVGVYTLKEKCSGNVLELQRN